MTQAGRASQLAVATGDAVHTARVLVEKSTGVLPVRPDVADLLPWRGLRRGATVAVRGSMSLLLAMLAEASAAGSWTAIVGVPDLGVLAAGELGISSRRLALLPRPGHQVAEVVAALVDGVDLVVTNTACLPAGHRAAVLARRLSARARHRGAVLVPVGLWPAADVELTCTVSRWAGLGAGHGYLTTHELDVTARGRGSATRPRHRRIVLGATRPTMPATAAPFGDRATDEPTSTAEVG